MSRSGSRRDREWNAQSRLSDCDNLPASLDEVRIYMFADHTGGRCAKFTGTDERVDNALPASAELDVTYRFV